MLERMTSELDPMPKALEDVLNKDYVEAIYDLSIEITNEFVHLYENKDWDGDWIEAITEFIRDLGLYEFNGKPINKLSIFDSFKCLSQNVDIKDINEIENWVKIQNDFEEWFKKWIKNSERELSDVKFFIEQATNIYEYIKAKIEV
jgi:hypothetical protein